MHHPATLRPAQTVLLHASMSPFFCSCSHSLIAELSGAQDVPHNLNGHPPPHERMDERTRGMRLCAAQQTLFILARQQHPFDCARGAPAAAWGGEGCARGAERRRGLRMVEQPNPPLGMTQRPDLSIPSCSRRLRSCRLRYLKSICPSRRPALGLLNFAPSAGGDDNNDVALSRLIDFDTWAIRALLRQHPLVATENRRCAAAGWILGLLLCPCCMDLASPARYPRVEGYRTAGFGAHILCSRPQVCPFGQLYKA